jgi:hypothetical protein
VAVVDVVAFKVTGQAGQVLVERATDDANSDGYKARQITTSSGDVVGMKAGTALEEAVAELKPAAQAILDGLKALSEGVKEIELEFGIKLTAEAGAIIARTAAEGHCTVSIKWTRD